MLMDDLGKDSQYQFQPKIQVLWIYKLCKMKERKNKRLGNKNKWIFVILINTKCVRNTHLILNSPVWFGLVNDISTFMG